jgi:hypothetical protein
MKVKANEAYRMKPSKERNGVTLQNIQTAKIQEIHQILSAMRQLSMDTP